MERQLRRRLKVSPDADNPVRIFVSPSLIKDVKALNFGHDGEAEFDECQRGLSPFAVPFTALATQRVQRKKNDAIKQATNTTPSDMLEVASDVKVIPPRDYTGLMRVLANYHKLLQEVVGQECHHFKEIVELQRALRVKVDVYDNISPYKILHILWAVLHDSRQFFTEASQWELGQPLPRSRLTYTTTFLQNGTILETEHCPIERFYPVAELPPPPPSPYGSGGGGSGHIDNLFQQAPYGGSGGPTGRSEVFKTTVHPLIEKVTGPLKNAHPQVTIGALMSAPDPPLKYSDLRIGTKGTCLEMNLFGVCRNNRCTYQHLEAKPTDSRAQAIANTVQRAAEAYEKKIAMKRKRGSS